MPSKHKQDKARKRAKQLRKEKHVHHTPRAAKKQPKPPRPVLSKDALWAMRRPKKGQVDMSLQKDGKVIVKTEEEELSFPSLKLALDEFRGKAEVYLDGKKLP